MTERLAELTANWTEVNHSVETACAAAGRNFSDVTIIAVTKTWPASDIDLLAEIGVRHVGENRDQEACAKRPMVSATSLTWHAIGQIQTNKVKSISTWADVVHSLDRIELVTAFAKALADSQRKLGVFIQVSLDEEFIPGRGGLPATELPKLAESILAIPQLELLGVMGVAPLAGAPEAAFARLRDSSTQLQKIAQTANLISAGMSSDYEIALNYGATHLRIGSAILGLR